MNMNGFYGLYFGTALPGVAGIIIFENETVRGGDDQVSVLGNGKHGWRTASDGPDGQSLCGKPQIAIQYSR
jgi:hypothetical protein